MQQHDLFPRAPFLIEPEANRRAPRLWVRRLVIWREPGTVIRDISLRPGLNVIWSPDATTANDRIGHGGGKSTLCRLLRYCLGEDSFAPDGQRLAIWNKLPLAQVGAEIMLDGEPWIVVRSLGVRRHDVVIRGGSFDEALRGHITPTGIEPLRGAITDAVLGDAAELMPAAIGKKHAWEAVLSWMARDQECRFRHHIEWRDPDSKSHSPVSGRSMAERLTVVRALIGALSATELAMQQREIEEDRRLRKYRSEVEQLDREIDRARARLSTALGFTAAAGVGLNLGATEFKAAAEARLAERLDLPAEAPVINLAKARAERDDARKRLQETELGLREISAVLDEKTRAIGNLKSLLPEAYAEVATGGKLVCPVCKVLIDEALAKGCGISLVKCDIEAVQAKLLRLRDSIRSEGTAIGDLRSRESARKSEVAALGERLRPLERAVAALERILFDRSAAIRAAERLIDDAQRHESLLAEREAAESFAKTAQTALEGTKETLAAYRDAVASTIARFSAMFDAVLREFVLEDISGEAKLDGNGLALRIELGGERTSAAIESLKVVAFDLAALALTIEGHTRLPGLLVHDSPREADLDASIYMRLFDFAKKLESFGPAPLFQYIVTTTTRPPEEFCTEPYLRLTIYGSPAEERLLGMDL